MAKSKEHKNLPVVTITDSQDNSEVRLVRVGWIRTALQSLEIMLRLGNQDEALALIKKLASELNSNP